MAIVEDPYPGVDNLEVMAEAVNYNKFLAGLIAADLRLGDRVLDFGAGSGTFARPLLTRGIDVTCVEPDRALRDHLKNAHVEVHASLDDVPAGGFNFIYTFNVLEHIEDDRRAVHELANKLACGGRLLIYVPAFQILFSSMDRKVGHYRRYRRPQIEALVTEAGLRITAARYADSLGFVASMLYRVIGDDAGKINRSALKLYDRLVFPVSRAFDVLLSPWIGKNLLVHAVKDRLPPPKAAL
jgi:SAM-dependent methyltransferase